MTGTAITEAEEFREIYGLEVVAIPTNKPVARDDQADIVYRTTREKWNAVVDRIAVENESGRPLLVGTISIEDSEALSAALTRRGIRHNVLNAKHHEREAEIISEAGQMGRVTIATNMAGRGTDIVLGDGVKEVGGLMVMGSERHESRRIDNQLRGRCGRQGDPGHGERPRSQLLLKLAGPEIMLILAVNVLAVNSLAVNGALHALYSVNN